MSKILDLRQKRSDVWDKAKAFLDERSGENGLMSGEDTAIYERMEQEVVDLGHAIEREERAAEIERELRSCAEADVALVLTTGGTGFSPRDVTPEATAAVCERMAPGIPEAMRAASMQITDRACLSREAAGICGRTLVVNLPGSPKAALENVSAVIGPIAHGLRILRGGQADCAAGE